MGARPLGKFMTIEDGPEDHEFIVRNKRSGDDLGKIEFYPPWRRLVFSPTESSVFSADCLMELVAEMNRLGPGSGRRG